MRERERVCVCVCVCVCACVCGHASTHVCACMQACVCVCVLDREGSWVFASTALEVVWMAMHLTGHSDYLTGFYEPLLPPYRCHAGL